MWFNNLEVLQQVCFVIGCITSLIMIVQIVLMLVGLDGDDSFETGGDFDGSGDIFNDEGFLSGLKILSLRSAIAFLCIGAWLTFTFVYVWPSHQWAAALIGIAGGAGAGFLVSLAILGFNKLQSEPELNIMNCMGKTAEIYLTVPAARIGKGKVNVLVQEQLKEFEAVTDGTTPLKTGTQAKVVGIDAGILIVEPFSA